jgi:hypothetical protein
MTEYRPMTAVLVSAYPELVEASSKGAPTCSPTARSSLSSEARPVGGPRGALAVTLVISVDLPEPERRVA